MRIKNKQVVLLKPNTYMNLSGNAVRYWKEKEGIEIENILVVVDDLALPFGALRIRSKGSDAGHNGLKNITAMLGSDAYPRLRFGIGNSFRRGQQAHFVLAAFSLEERQTIDARIETAVEAVKDFCLAAISHAMCQFNNK